MAMTTRITTGIKVHATSSSVLWVVRDGVGLALALNLTMMISNSASTKAEIAMMIQSTKVWNETMLSITGVTDP